MDRKILLLFIAILLAALPSKAAPTPTGPFQFNVKMSNDNFKNECSIWRWNWTFASAVNNTSTGV